MCKSHTRDALLMRAGEQNIYTKERLAVKYIFHSTDDGEQHPAALHRYHDTVQYSGPQTDHYKMGGCCSSLPAWRTAHHALQAGRLQ